LVGYVPHKQGLTDYLKKERENRKKSTALAREENASDGGGSAEQLNCLQKRGRESYQTYRGEEKKKNIRQKIPWRGRVLVMMDSAAKGKPADQTLINEFGRRSTRWKKKEFRLTEAGTNLSERKKKTHLKCGATGGVQSR